MTVPIYRGSLSLYIYIDIHIFRLKCTLVGYADPVKPSSNKALTNPTKPSYSHIKSDRTLKGTPQAPVGPWGSQAAGILEDHDGLSFGVISFEIWS